MAEKQEKFFVSTAIYYVNAYPHLGHALEEIQADVIARHRRNSGDEVLFLSGTDENSLKNVQAAKKEGVPVKELVDKNAERFYGLKKLLNLSFDDFIRTTEERHVKGAQKLWLSCEKDIYKKKYKGLYCVGCEEFYKEGELVNGLCPEHKTKPDAVEEEDYFFKLSNYQGKLKKIIEEGEIEIVPKSRRNEVLNFIDSGLEDICISRSSLRAQGWGVDVPGDETQKIWVWFDALSNYINALGYGEDGKDFGAWWKNGNTLHVIGKGILRFHAVYWPAILLSAGLPLPKKVFVHGYITVGGEKMSKSLGNIVDPFLLVEKYGADAVRYFLLREIPPTEDGDFTYEKFEKRYNGDLASGIGNLVARLIAMASKFGVAEGKKIGNSGLEAATDKTLRNYEKSLDRFEFNAALASIWELIGFCDRLIEENKLWEGKESQKKLISDLLCVINSIVEMLNPFLPETSEKISRQIISKKSEILFPRIR